MRGLCYRPVSVVRPSVTLMHCIHMVEDIVKLLPRPGSPVIRDFLTQCADISLQRGTQNSRSGKNWQFSTEITVYLGNGTR